MTHVHPTSTRQLVAGDVVQSPAGSTLTVDDVHELVGSAGRYSVTFTQESNGHTFTQNVAANGTYRVLCALEHDDTTGDDDTAAPADNGTRCTEDYGHLWTVTTSEAIAGGTRELWTCDVDKCTATHTELVPSELAPLDVWAAYPGLLVRNTRTGTVARIDRITPAGAAGTSHADGPTIHAQPVTPSGELADIRYSIWTGSRSYPAGEWANYGPDRTPRPVS